MSGLAYDQLVRGHYLSWYDLVGEEMGGGGGVGMGVMVWGVSQCCHVGCWRICWEVFQTAVQVG